MTHLHSILLLLLIAFTGFALSAGEPSSFKISTQRADDRVETSLADGAALVSIHSPMGISHATVQRVADCWPRQLTVQLHLRGLENLRIGNGQITIETRAPSRDQEHLCQMWKDNTANERLALDTHSPYWIEIRMPGKDVKPNGLVPRDERYYELRLPPALLEENPKAISIGWIDFYR